MTHDSTTPEQGLPAADPAGHEPQVADDPAAFDTSVAHQARMYNYLLGGKDNFEADRRAGEAAKAAYPDMVHSMRANRALLGRVVRCLAADEGVRQFLDIGTGIPTTGNTHEVAQEVAPQSRVVYVDYDPVVLAHARALLTSDPAGATDYLDADLRDPAAILAGAAHTLDFSRPVAVTLLMILHAVGDEDDPHRLVGTIMDAMPPGSYLAISHPASDLLEPQQAEELKGRLNRLSFQQYTPRSRAEVQRFFDGMELLPPGLVDAQHWRPAVPATRSTGVWAAVGRKP